MKKKKSVGPAHPEYTWRTTPCPRCRRVYCPCSNKRGEKK